MSVKVEFSLEEANALYALAAMPEEPVEDSALEKLQDAIRVVELREGDEQLVGKLTALIELADGAGHLSSGEPERLARAAVAAVEEHREGKK